VAWNECSGVRVTYALTNRTKKVRLAEVVDAADLRRELDHVRRLRFTDAELRWLRGSKFIPKGTFCGGFLKFLRGLRLPPYVLSVVDGQFDVRVAGTWPEAILWETIVLCLVNELYYRALMKRDGADPAAVRAEGRRRLRAKLGLFRERSPEVRFIEFGTRRRFSRRHQEDVVRACLRSDPAMVLGTSNVSLARKFGIKPIGTFAHEMFMVMAALMRGSDEFLRASHNHVLRLWWGRYGEGLSIALTDTFGTDFFFRDFTPEQAAKWRGLRQDSGDPVAFGEKAIAFYRGLGIDPATKTIVFSDGLDEGAIAGLQAKFAGRVRVAFGWGTNLTNDCGYGSLSLVVKVVLVGDAPTVKLSDNIAKAMGPADEVERYKRVFGYAGGEDKDCVY